MPKLKTFMEFLLYMRLHVGGIKMFVNCCLIMEQRLIFKEPLMGVLLSTMPPRKEGMRW